MSIKLNHICFSPCREVFEGFAPEVVSKFDEKKIAALKADDIIRQPEAKVRSIIDNAKHVLKVRMRDRVNFFL
jgi:3-methyladenine DNA glycosylase Tag